jgi:hypothetical protein
VQWGRKGRSLQGSAVFDMISRFLDALGMPGFLPQPQPLGAFPERAQAGEGLQSASVKACPSAFRPHAHAPCALTGAVFVFRPRNSLCVCGVFNATTKLLAANSKSACTKSRYFFCACCRLPGPGSMLYALSASDNRNHRPHFCSLFARFSRGGAS